MHAGLAVELLALLAVGVAVAVRRWTVAFLALAAAAEVGLYLAMTELGFSGNPRYVVPALALLCVLAGVGVANLLQARPARGGPALAALCLFGSSLRGRSRGPRAATRHARWDSGCRCTPTWPTRSIRPAAPRP